MELTAVMAARLVVAAADPVNWVMFAAALYFGARRHPAWTPIALAAVFTVINVAMVFSWWREIGLADYWLGRSIEIFLAKLVWAYALYGIGRAAAKLTSRPA